MTAKLSALRLFSAAAAAFEDAREAEATFLAQASMLIEEGHSFDGRDMMAEETVSAAQALRMRIARAERNLDVVSGDIARLADILSSLAEIQDPLRTTMAISVADRMLLQAYLDDAIDREIGFIAQGDPEIRTRIWEVVQQTEGA